MIDILQFCQYILILEQAVEKDNPDRVVFDWAGEHVGSPLRKRDAIQSGKANIQKKRLVAFAGFGRGRQWQVLAKGFNLSRL